MTNSKRDVLTERTEIPVGDGSTMGGYLARPVPDGPYPGRRPGVLVAHELFGVTAHVREVCERLAGRGYLALAPDFFHRSEPAAELPHDAAGRERGFDLLAKLRRDETVADAAASLAKLGELGNRRAAVVGLSLGGHIGYLAATALPFAAVVAAYPGWLTGTEIGISRPQPTVDLTPGIGGRVLILCGGADRVISGAEMDTVGAALTAAGTRHEIVSYPGVQHGFMCDWRDGYDPAAAADSWSRIDALLDAELLN